MNRILSLIRTVWGWFFTRRALPALVLRRAVRAAKARMALPPHRNRRMDATALNDRRGSGVRCRGFLGRPTVAMLG